MTSNTIHEADTRDVGLSRKEVASRLCCSVATVRRYEDSGALKPQTGDRGKRLHAPSQVDALANELGVTGAAASPLPTNDAAAIREIFALLDQGDEPTDIVIATGHPPEVVHAAITDPNGRFRRYKIVDPSFHNWSGLAMALRNTQISDFPLCNKSFNLSYCGFDL